MTATLGAQENLVANGSFALDADGDGVPDGWASAGAVEVKQELTVDMVPGGGRAGKLTCTAFATGSPSNHAMLCQVGRVAVKQGQWYRLSWRARARDMQISAVQVALSNTSDWSNTGLSYSFPVGSAWRDYEHVFRSQQDLAAADSRLQFWFASTGTFWLADVALIPVDEVRYEYHPQIDIAGVTNVVPNSSFECGTAGWGSYYPEMRTWAGNVFSLIGEIDDQHAFHGKHSLRVEVVKGQAPVFMWDWFELVEEEILAPMAVHHGWIPVEAGETYVVACALKAGKQDVPARIMVRDGTRNRDKRVTVGTQWQQFSMAFTPTEGYVWAGVGPDLTESDLDAATLWIDAVHVGKAGTEQTYQPRAVIESHIETAVTGNTFDDPGRGISVRVTGCNSSGDDAVIRGTLTVTDFFDAQIHSEDISLPVKAGENAVAARGGLARGRTGFFRVVWSPASASALPQSLRCMLITPYADDDSVFGMNHAYGWPFLLRLSKQAGLRWWRDWSVKWDDVEPRKGQFDFSRTDPQIDRIVNEGLNLEVMFPFPSSDWSTTADMDAITEIEPNRYRHQVLRFACAPNSEEDFRNYVSRSVRQYRDRIQYFQVFNEPVYTHYSLPRRLGYTVPDYIRLLNVAADAIRAESKDAVVVGGMGIWASSGWTHDFVKAGGLANVDILDLHNYPVTADAEGYEPDMAELARMMKERGEVRPMWLTEYGCYADDDPYRTPQRVGDAAMAKCLWPNEREAARALVQAAAVFCTHGLRKIFLHAGSCGSINGSSAGGVFFEYGGTPRKMLPAVWALSSLLDADFQPVQTGPQPTDMRVYTFKVTRGILAIAWTRQEAPVRVTTTGDIAVIDIMGNPLDKRVVDLTATPVYFLSTTQTAQALKRVLSTRK